jgi:hypothetical protein
MNTAIVLLLLLGFSICMVVGLVTVLQSLVNQPPEPINEVRQGPVLSDQGVEP